MQSFRLTRYKYKGTKLLLGVLSIVKNEAIINKWQIDIIYVLHIN